MPELFCRSASWGPHCKKEAMDPSAPDVSVVLVAAGSSSRMGSARSKVWLDLDGEPLLARSLATLAPWARLANVALVVRGEEVAEAEALVRRVAASLAARTSCVAGGAERVDSVRAGLAALAPDGALVLVHDAARPLASLALFERVAEAAARFGAAVPALAVVDTLKRVDPIGRLETVARAGLHAVQTPQGFRRDLLERAHAASNRPSTVTDDAQLVEALGAAIVLVEGEPWNVKVTVPADLELARRLTAGGSSVRERRIGLGHDLHPLAAGGPLRLGGCDLEGDLHAVGHSDGDALLHAVADAVLGACALGDLGQHFSDRAEENRGRDSADFLRHVVTLARARGFAPAQVDAVVRLERPKVAPHRERIVARLAALLGLATDAVSVKAKTAEGLGEIGASRAVACEAIVQMERIAT
jgi:2-C-methyl-D-erythritol 4-phosphate cytidylyltransferase / 2-C-methyl-D-erythritol 2,4-cyclodiphosphate synthase